ncbi:Glycoside hydrolase, clan GH-D [Cordyceps fumosorosea ARSEF 2679]|uniref:Glycoside hydrolase, clan GH-D n=1 Tax=Cordyceps fumosorosea (strain ARSEF 2679) TaxID=1081104 RepID=A0A167DRV3_CORFA|nr:Glycoside hydrolase, clan GH-D [Cordyceps fumosorosea ARSEF 2679]OAA42777.1 Glycoside hydrolase, clan GH-D [Cordyceps fumosorosea ARSEF 2679]
MAYTNEDEPAQPIQNPADPQPKYAEKQYTALAQGMLINLRRNKDLVVQPCSNDDEVPRDLLPLLDSSDWPINGIDDLSDKFQAQLREDRVVGLPGCFFPLQRHYTYDEQAKAAAPSLCYLREIGIISKIGHSNEERLRTVAKNTFELPAILDDTMLPDLLSKFTIMEVARNGQS